MNQSSRKRLLMFFRLGFLILIGVYGLFNFVWFHGLKIDTVTSSFSRAVFISKPFKTVSIGIGIWLHLPKLQEKAGLADTLQLMNTSLDSIFLTLSRTISDPLFDYQVFIMSKQSQHYWVRAPVLSDACVVFILIYNTSMLCTEYAHTTSHNKGVQNIIYHS